MNLTPEADYYEKHLMNSPTWLCFTDDAKDDPHAAAMANRYVHRPAIEFYDTKSDPWELNNLVSEKKHAKRIAKMRQELEKWMKSQGDKGAEIDAP